MNEAGDRAAIEAVIVEYLEGMIYGQAERLERTMHPQCMQAGHYQGRYEFYGRDELIETLTSDKTEPPGAPYQARIVMVDISGDAAIAKVQDDCFGTSLTNYLTLIRHEGRWQVIMKAFYDHADANPEENG